MRRLIFMLSLAALIVIAILTIRATRADALDENNCLSCHNNPSLSTTTKSGAKVSLFVNADLMNTTAHRYIDCTTCHGSDPHKVPTALDKLSLAQKCGTCHQYEYKQHLQSVHGQQLAQGNPDVATCVDCHSPTANPHNVVRVLEYNAPTYKKNVSATCAKCHDNQQLMATYGIVEKVYESYMRSFHGKAIQLGTYELTKLDEATCTNCHGVHDIKSVADPTSPVAGLENLAKTCEQCHPGAGIEFAKGFLGHREASQENIPAAHYTENIFKVLLTSVLAFGAFVVVAAVVRYSITKWKE